MMQHVATAKSEVAAFATDTGANSLTDPESNEQFDKFLQQSTDEINKLSSSTPVEYTSEKIKSLSNAHTNSFDAQISSLSQDKPAIQSAVESDTSGIDAQVWVSLVDNLQKLADIAQLTKPSSVDAEIMLALDDVKKLKDDSSIEETSGNVLANAENETLAELNLAENKALLKTLLIDSETDKTYTSEKLMQPQQVATDLPHSSKDENVAGNNDIKNILNLSENKLDKVLENIAQRIFDSKNTGESSKDFIYALKAGLEEFNNQLSQGREPGIDLKALVSDALAKTNESGSVAKDPINLEKIVKSVSQVLDVAQSMNRVIEQNHDQTYSTSSRDVAHIQGEQSKQIQSNQFESKFEKTINLAKPEGNQQLAEKVRWMMNTKNLVAEIRLDPAELGSMHVKVAISGETATVNFVVQSQQARDAVDTATPKLKEMLAEKGIELGQSSVRQESDDQQGQGDGELAKQGDRGETETEDIEVPEQVFAQHNIINGALGGIDYFV
jgi:flagellar hook-length control protein FliK